jgi:large subunit ribosomal protein L17
MRHRVKKTQKIGSNREHSTSIIRGLAVSVIINEKVQTTRPRAKAVQPFVEKLITAAKTHSIANAIRLIEAELRHDDASKKIIEELLKRYAERTSGFTRLLRIGNRKGDNAPLVQLELV